MTAITRPVEGSPAIQLPLWSWMAVLASLFGIYLLLQENGLLLAQWEVLHELLHDGRHAFGMPCH